MTLTRRAATRFVALTLLMTVAAVEAQGPVIYRPPLTIPESLEPFLKYLEPGSDAIHGRARGPCLERTTR